MVSSKWVTFLFAVLVIASFGIVGLVDSAEQTRAQQANQTNQTQLQTDTVRGDPELDVFLPQKTVQPGETTTVNIQIRNDGRVTENGAQQFESYVTTARDVEVAVEADRDVVTVESGTTAVQNIPRGRPVTVPVTISVPEDAAGSYDLDVDIDYNYYQSVEYRGATIVDTDRDFGFESEEVEVSVRDAPIVTATATDSNTTVGETGTTTFTLRNTGEADMRNARLRLQTTTGSVALDGGQQGTYYLGRFDEDDTKQVDVPITYTQTAQPATRYYLQANIVYENTDGQQRQTAIDNVFVSPEPLKRVIATQVDTSTPIGGTGESTLFLRNTGDETLDDATVQVSSRSPAVLFAGQSTTTSVQVGSWGPNEEKRIPVTTAVSPDAVQTRYAVDATVQYDTENNIPNQISVDNLGIIPQPEQTFQTGIMGTNVSEGEEGVVRVGVQNGGPKDADNVRLTLRGDSGLSVTKTTFNIGEIPAGERADVDVPVEATSNLETLRQGLDATVTYETDTTTRQQVEESFLSTQVEPAPNRFTVGFANETRLAPGEGRTVTVAVTNNRDTRLQNVDAKFTGNGPVSLSRSSAFLNELGPNETRTVNITVQAGGNAIPNTHPVEVDFQYETADGDSRLSEVYQLPVTITEPPENQGPSLIVIVGVLGVVIIALGGGAYYYRDKLRDAL